MFLPVGITVTGGGTSRASYNRILNTSAKFDRLARQAKDMTVPLTRVGTDLRTQIEAAFATEGAMGASGKWHPLSPAYGAWKRKHGPGVPLLVGLRPVKKGTRQKPTRPQSYTVSGVMRRQLLMPLSDRLTWRIGPQRLLYLPSSNIAGYHETGTGRMPARPPIDPTIRFLHSIDRTFLVWLNELLAETNLAA